MEDAGTLDQRLDRLAVIVDALAAPAVAHDDPLEAQARNISAQGQNIDRLIILADKRAGEMAEIGKQWQAYLTTVHPRQ